MGETAVATVAELAGVTEPASVGPLAPHRLAARVLATRLVGRRLGIDPVDVRIGQTCATCGGPHGRPQVVGHDVHVGWAHSGGLVAAVVDDRPCAIDLEALPLRGVVPLDTLTPGERAWLDRQPGRDRAFAELWVRKEVLVKLGLVDLDESFGLDVTPSLRVGSGPDLVLGVVLGVVLRGLDVTAYDAVAAWGSET